MTHFKAWNPELNLIFATVKQVFSIRFGDLANGQYKLINQIVPIVGGVTIWGLGDFFYGYSLHICTD